MSHPFDLNLSDLEAIEIDFEKQLTDEESAQVSGGGHIQCISAPCPGSEGGGSTRPPSFEFPPIKFPPIKFPVGEKPSKDPPNFTTKAGGEEGGEFTTLALGEEGGVAHISFYKT